ncbi:MAG: CpsD/CapB family tyrosine-protein kinase [Anaerolineales bacterium]|nr:CpsD/CapB family tyrosine-protein kinase [Anaerolineales bacterium]
MPEDRTSTLITISNPRSPISEAFRTLRTNLEFTSLDKPIRSMVVTSASPEEGKSTTLANLAVAVAQAGKKVILVDCDLRRPSLHQIFDARNTPGFTDMMRDDALMNQPPLQETAVPNLFLLPSGTIPPNPAELLASRRMSDVIAALQQHAEIVLFDAPPVIAVTDAAVLSSKVDAVLLVVSAGKTKREHAKKAKALLDKVNAHLIGTVLNNVKGESNLYQYYASGEKTK